MRFDQLPELPHVRELDLPSNWHEFTKAISQLKNHKSPGSNGVPGEIYKFGGQILLNFLFEVIVSYWDTEQISKSWKNAIIVSIYLQEQRRQG